MTTFTLFAWRLALIGMFVSAMMQNILALYMFGAAALTSIGFRIVLELNERSKPPRQ